MTEPSFKNTPRDGGVPIHLNFSVGEGEFSKQLFKKIFIPLMVNGCNFSLAEVTKLFSEILGEAIKEFPKMLASNNITETKELMDVWNWFLKWFGDEK